MSRPQGKKQQKRLPGSDQNAFGEPQEQSTLDLSNESYAENEMEQTGSRGGGGGGAAGAHQTSAEAARLLDDLDKKRDIESMAPDELAVYFFEYCLTPEFIAGMKDAGGSGPGIRGQMRIALRKSTGDEDWSPGGAMGKKVSKLERGLTVEMQKILNRAHNYFFDEDGQSNGSIQASADEPHTNEQEYYSEELLARAEHDPDLKREIQQKQGSRPRSASPSQSILNWKRLDENGLATMNFNNALVTFADQRKKGSLKGFSLMPPKQEVITIRDTNPEFNVKVAMSDEKKAAHNIYNLPDLKLSLVTQALDEGKTLAEAFERTKKVHFRGSEADMEAMVRRELYIPPGETVKEWFSKNHPHLGVALEFKEWGKVAKKMNDTPWLREIIDRFFNEDPAKIIPTTTFLKLMFAYEKLEGTQIIEDGMEHNVKLSDNVTGETRKRVIIETGLSLLNHLIEDYNGGKSVENYEDEPHETEEVFALLKEAQSEHADLKEENGVFVAKKGGEEAHLA